MWPSRICRESRHPRGESFRRVQARRNLPDLTPLETSAGVTSGRSRPARRDAARPLSVGSGPNPRRGVQDAAGLNARSVANTVRRLTCSFVGSREYGGSSHLFVRRSRDRRGCGASSGLFLRRSVGSRGSRWVVSPVCSEVSRPVMTQSSPRPPTSTVARLVTECVIPPPVGWPGFPHMLDERALLLVQGR